ncbi:MAG TPA: hypothetical protein P5230_02625 [Candidatus Magasanikbacteria bacterium]|nr:hypothetical protein [Candidatus Magasanikbacteria bacterium]
MFLNKKSIKITLFSLLFCCILLLPFFVFSQDFGMSETAAKSGYDTASDNIYVSIGKVLNVAFAAIAFIFFGLTLYAGLRWLTARGKEEFIERAKATMEGAVIGLIITVLSYGITTFIISRVGSFSGKSGCCIYSDSCINVANQSDCINGGAFHPAESEECLFDAKCP